MPTNIFKIINDNIVTLSENVDKMHQKIDILMSIFYQSSGDATEMPKTDGVAPSQL